MLARASFIVVAAIALPAAASDRFAAADSDADGALSRAEMQRAFPRLAAEFDAIDRNRDGDGSLTRSELQAWFDGRRAARSAFVGTAGR